MCVCYVSPVGVIRELGVANAAYQDLASINDCLTFSLRWVGNLQSANGRIDLAPLAIIRLGVRVAAAGRGGWGGGGGGERERERTNTKPTNH